MVCKRNRLFVCLFSCLSCMKHTCYDSRTMTQPFSYSFPAVRGIQAGREYYVSMCPLRLLIKLFDFVNDELPAELRAQRTLNKSRVPEISRYIVSNLDSYTLSAITASIDGPVSFTPLGDGSSTLFRTGELTVDLLKAKIIVNDGQHRHAAIKDALKNSPGLAEETIAVVFFLDRGLKRCQQMFADLNRHSVKPSPSLSVLYEHRNVAANIAKQLGLQSQVFKDLIETERSSLSERSRKLFTLSALHFSILEMLSAKELEDFGTAAQKCLQFWEVVGEQIPEWEHVRQGKMTAGEVRQHYIHSHAVVLQALGRVGKSIFQLENFDLRAVLKNLEHVDWSRKNIAVWDGRSMQAGRMSKSSQSTTLTSNEIKRVLGLALSKEEQNVEDAFLAAKTARNSAN